MIFKLILTCTCLFCMLRPSAQTGKGEQKLFLISQLQKAQSDSIRQKLYYQLGEHYLVASNQNSAYTDSAFYYARKSVYLLDSANPTNNHITDSGLITLANVYFRIRDITVAKKIFLQVIASYHHTAGKLKEAELWYKLGEKLFQLEEEFDCIDSSFKQASNLYYRLGLPLKKIESDFNLAFFHFRLGKDVLAAKELVNVIKLSQENKNYKLTDILLLIAQVKRYIGDFDEALRYAIQVQKLIQQTKDTLNTHLVYGELALIYEEMSDPASSVYWYKQCIQERVRMHLGGFMIYRTAYLMTVQMVKAGKAQECASILQDITKKIPPNPNLETAILDQSLAYCYNALGQYARAESAFLEMIKIYNTLEQGNEMLFIANYDIGNFYVTQHEYNRAAPYIEKAFLHQEGPSVSRIKDLHLLAFQVDSAAGRYLGAIQHFQKYKALNDSLFSEAKSKQIEELKIKYDLEKKQQNFTILQKENMVQQNQLKQAVITRNFVIASIGLLALITVLLYNRYTIKRNANEKLTASQNEIERQNNSLKHLVTEKEWLLKEIHHRVKNNLHTIIGLLDTQASFLKNEEAIVAVNDSQHRIQAMSLIHQKLFQSEGLSTVEMSPYIHELVDYLEHSLRTPQNIRFRIEVDHCIFNLSHALPIGLILNEAITNSIKYAFPNGIDGLIAVYLKTSLGDGYKLIITDNGIGLPPDFDSKKSCSMGMNLMRGLSEDLHGQFCLSAKGGTTLEVSFAYNQFERA